MKIFFIWFQNIVIFKMLRFTTGDVQAAQEKAADNHAAECIPQVKFVEKVYDLHNSSEKLQNNFDEFDQDKPLERSLPLDLSVENNKQMGGGE